jgi:iron complex transport system substrate-binding protein
VRHRFLAGTLAVGVLLTGCRTAGSEAPASPTAAGSSKTFPLTVTDDEGVSVSIDHLPQRIVTFAPSMTEIVFALGIGDRVIGVSGSYDDYPPQAKGIEEIGGAGDSGVDPNIERVVSLEPDLFLTIAGGDQWKKRLRDLDVPVVTLNATDFEDLLHDIRTVGLITGTMQAADTLTSQMQARADDVASEVSAQGRVSCFFEVYYPPLLSVGPGTFIYDLLVRAGCDPVTSGAKSDYPEWSVDELVANAPDVYIATPESAKSAASIAHRPGFGDIEAVADGHVALIDSDLVTRPGPRVVDALEQLATDLHT